MNRRIAQGEVTRRQLIDVATRLFAEQGYEDTSTEQVLRDAGASRGSLYHHFDGKDRLFEAVVEHVEEGVVERLMTVVSRHRDPVKILRAGCAQWIALVEAGHTVRGACDGLEAIVAIEESAPHAMVLDLMMPGLDGHGVLRTMRERDMAAETRVLVLTCKLHAGEFIEAWQLGADEYVT